MGIKLELRDVRFSYDGKKDVITGISFSILPRELLCLLGPNGSGKSTLLRCICRLNRIDDGMAMINGKDINTYSTAEIAKKISFIPQLHQPSFPFTVNDFVLMGRTPHLGIFESPTRRDYEIAYNSMKDVGILPFKDKPYTHLSGGQMQLALLARALTQEPEILLLDEPTSHLDLPNQAKILLLIRNLSKRGISVIMTSQFPDHAFISSGKVGLLNGGTLLPLGLADDVLTEENLRQTYHIDVKVTQIGDGINRKICIPMIEKNLEGR